MQAGTRSVPAKSGPPLAWATTWGCFGQRLGQIAPGAALRAAPGSIRPLLTAQGAAVPARASSGWP